MLATQKLADRWDGLKSIIEQLYLKEKKKVSEVAAILRRDYEFDMVPHQYKSQFKKWNWKKNISAAEKNTIVANYQCRAAFTKNPSQITRYSPPIQVEKIRRHMKELFRTRVQNFDWKFDVKDTSGRVLISNGPILLFGSRLFRHWAKVQGLAQSPEVVDGNTTLSHLPRATQSTVLAQRSLERALLLVQGRYGELMCSMNNNERLLMSEWLSEYWLFSFKTVKYWGRGPQAWTGKLLEFDQVKESARAILSKPLDSSKNSGETLSDEVPKPGRLCGWFIHVRPETQHRAVPEKYLVYGVTDTVIGYSVKLDDLDEGVSLLDWSKFQPKPSLQQKLQDALENNDFSTSANNALPVAIPRIAAATKKPPTSLLLEALGFSIMSRNIDQLREILQQVRQTNTDVTSIYPLHLATSYLDGHKSCCIIIRTLLQELDFRQIYVNQHGHTVLDNLMITILRSHTSLQPQDLNDVLTHFEGEEVDICGRWDADSDCYRILRAVGDTPIPISWKHKFCHTSIQAVCHSMQVIWSHASVIVESSDSGLYLRHCFGCGLKLQLGSLHVVVMTAFHLACHSFADEDMFGMLAFVLRLISLGIDPCPTASISVRALLQGEDLEDTCDHEDFTPAEFCYRLSMYSDQYRWSTKVRVGWGVLYATLHQSEMAERMGCIYPLYFQPFIYFQPFTYPQPPIYPQPSIYEKVAATLWKAIQAKYKKDTATLWKVIQAELNLYRRMDDFDEWHSAVFKMDSILSRLQEGRPQAFDIVPHDFLNTHCICVKFGLDCDNIATFVDIWKDPSTSNYHSFDRATAEAEFTGDFQLKQKT